MHLQCCASAVFLFVLIRMRTFLYQWTEGGGKPVTSHLSWSLSPSLTLTSPGLPASILAVGATGQKVLVFRGKTRNSFKYQG
jgi:hypothetical protein